MADAAPTAATRVAIGGDTFPKLLLHNAEIRGDRPAIREKDFGIWQVWTWADVLDEITAASLGFVALGLAKGDKIAIIGANRPRLYWSMVAAQAVGAIPVPVYADSVAEEMAFVLEHAEARFAVVEDQEQVDKILSVAEQLPMLDEIIYDETRGMRDYDPTHLHSFETVQQRGREVMSADPSAVTAWRAGIDATTGSDISVILYTSGTTGRPKGVMLSFDNLIRSATNGNHFDSLGEEEETLAYLPLAWIGDHVFSLAQCYTAGYCVNCPENMETVYRLR